MAHTFLTLAQNASIEAGIPGPGMTSVENASGMNARLVKWIHDAWSEIQLMHHKRWRFMQNDAAFSTVEGTAPYNSTEFGAEDIVSVVGDELEIDDGRTVAVVDENEWRALGHHRNITIGVPTHCLLTNAQTMTLSPTPDAVYNITYRYVREVQELANNADLLLCPERYIRVVEYAAAMRYAQHLEDQVRISAFYNQYQSWLGKLEMDQLPSLAQAGW
ncbi:MAG: hypothetical protein RPR28_07700 [Cycloclasticus sp.]